MSRTDKDEPHWVRGLHSETRTPSHHWDCEASQEHHGAWRRSSTPLRECDLDNPHTHGWRHACSWAPNDRHKYTWTSRPPKDLIHDYYGSERGYVRDLLHEAIKEYQGSGDTDVDVVNRQHRHTPWGGGWWD